MAFQTLSQTTYPRVQTIINAKGDTLIQMSLNDAKTVLKDVLDKSYADSLVDVYTVRDSINTNVITLQKEELKLMSDKFNNQKSISANLTQVLADKDKEISDKDDIIKQQKKEIRKQKILKVVGFTAAVVLPIIAILLLHH
jgi:uncharacterized membrane protein YvbJ